MGFGKLRIFSFEKGRTDKLKLNHDPIRAAQNAYRREHKITQRPKKDKSTARSMQFAQQ